MRALSHVTQVPYNKLSSTMTSKIHIPDPGNQGATSEPKDLIQRFIIEQSDKLSDQEAIRLNSRIKRTFSRP